MVSRFLFQDQRGGSASGLLKQQDLIPGPESLGRQLTKPLLVNGCEQAEIDVAPGSGDSANRSPFSGKQQFGADALKPLLAQRIHRGASSVFTERAGERSNAYTTRAGEFAQCRRKMRMFPDMTLSRQDMPRRHAV